MYTSHVQLRIANTLIFLVHELCDDKYFNINNLVSKFKTIQYTSVHVSIYGQYHIVVQLLQNSLLPLPMQFLAE